MLIARYTALVKKESFCVKVFFESFDTYGNFEKIHGRIKNSKDLIHRNNLIWQTKMKYDASNYLICVIQEFGHRRVFSPDFDIHFTVPVSNDPHKWTTITLQQMEVEIGTRLKKLEQTGGEPPTPKKWREVVNSTPQDLITVDEVANLLKVSKSTVRRIAELPVHETPGGHRRYSMKEVQAWIQSGKNS